MNVRTLVLSASAALLIAGCGGDDEGSTQSGDAGASATDAAERTKPKVDVPKGSPPKDLEVTDLIEGSGPAASAGDLVTVQYVGVEFESGKEFDASWDRGEPFRFSSVPAW